MKILKNDKVLVITGVDKGKVGKVLQAIPKSNKIIVEGVNLKYKHIRRDRDHPRGDRVRREAPIDVSNVKIICPSCGKPTRVGYKVNLEAKKERKLRICKKCKQIIPKIL